MFYVNRCERADKLRQTLSKIKYSSRLSCSDELYNVFNFQHVINVIILAQFLCQKWITHPCEEHYWELTPISLSFESALLF